VYRCGIYNKINNLIILKNMEEETLTTEEIQQHYRAMMDSVNLINGGKPEEIDSDEWDDTVSRNKEHLQIMIDKDFWTDEDLSPVSDILDA
jgi:hypothetical protein